MIQAEVRKSLEKMIQADRLHFFRRRATLTGYFTVKELEMIVFWMRLKIVPKEGQA